MSDVALVHLAAGVGNLVLATPLLVALERLGLTVDVWLNADYPDSADLLRGWSAVRRITSHPGGDYPIRVPAVPPFYWHAFRHAYEGLRGVVARPSDALFYTNEQAYYFAFARRLGYRDSSPSCFLPIAPVAHAGVGGGTLVLAPGCKTGEMAAKRWPWFPELACGFPDVAVVGIRDDLRRFDGGEMRFAPHVRVLAGALGLRETAEVMAAAGAVVANDCGLGHVAAALGVPTVLLFGPTPDRTLGPMPPNVRVMRAGLPCEPCWFGGGRLHACSRRVDCLRQLDVDRVADVVGRLWAFRPPAAQQV